MPCDIVLYFTSSCVSFKRVNKDLSFFQCILITFKIQANVKSSAAFLSQIGAGPSIDFTVSEMAADWHVQLVHYANGSAACRHTTA